MNANSRNSDARPPAAAAAQPEAARRSITPRSTRGRIGAGVLIIAPLAVTIVLLQWLYAIVLYVGVKIRFALGIAVDWIVSKPLQGLNGNLPIGTGQPPAKVVRPATPTGQEDWLDILVAISLTVVMLYLLGWLGSKVLGRRLIDTAESLFERIPLVDMIYGSIKGMVQALAGVGKKGDQTQRIVLIDFPTENMKTIGFLTNQITDANSGQVYATVYVPTTPNPTSGYMELVPIERVTETDLTMEQALTMVLSGGASSPPSVHLRRWTGSGAQSPPRLPGPA